MGGRKERSGERKKRGEMGGRNGSGLIGFNSCHLFKRTQIETRKDSVCWRVHACARKRCV